ncbi:MAG: metallopeptidase family protein [Verrucomicrobiaceae bacterium]|nr:metallopeptidase family protein [Verrucomicrobiaceae bacterium]
MNLRRAEFIARQVTRGALARLPENLREQAEACVIEFALAEECVADEPELDADLLGLFEGCSRLDGDPETPEDLPRIRLFLDNLWDHAEGDPRVFRDELRITLLHELGHYLGLDEDQVAALGLA